MHDHHNTAALPSWFRLGIIAVVTLTLCSCQVAVIPEPETIEQRQSIEQMFGDASAKISKSDSQEESTLQVVEPSAPKLEQSPPAGPPRGLSVSETGVSAAIELTQAESFVDSVGPIASPSDEPRIANACPLGGCDDSSCDNGSCNGGSCEGGYCESGCPVGAPCYAAPYTGPGPKDEYLCDGGDCGLPVGVRADWTIDGLEEEDTIAHYDTLDGRVLVEPSNKVCIYAPRFGAVRRVVNASESLQRELINVFEDDMALARADMTDTAATSLQQLPPVTKIGELPPSLLLNRQQAGELEARVVVRELKNLIKPYCNLQIVQLGLVDNAEKPWLAKATVAAVTWTGDQAAQVTISGQAASVLKGTLTPGVMYADCQGDPCLRLVKLASTDHAQPGDEIEFTLRFDNVGAQEIGNVTIVDNLTTRLAYVPDTAEASVDAKFSTKDNGSGSEILRWEITKPLKPGEGGVLQFRVKVR